jgi:hypothetical protein
MTPNTTPLHSIMDPCSEVGWISEAPSTNNTETTERIKTADAIRFAD